ncbi:hypothetical protein ACFS3C_24190 [Azotobacter vinelandii]
MRGLFGGGPDGLAEQAAETAAETAEAAEAAEGAELVQRIVAGEFFSIPGTDSLNCA